MNRKGFTLIELEVCLVIAAILVLIIGAISSMSHTYYTRINRETIIYADLSYAIKFMQKVVRESENISRVTNGSGNWLGNYRLNVDGGAFGFYDSGSRFDLVYVKDLSNVNNREVLIPNIRQNANGDAVFDIVSCAPDCTDARSVEIRLTGRYNDNNNQVNDDVSFNIQFSLLRRTK